MHRPACLIATLFFVALVASKFNPDTGFTSLIRFGESWRGRRLPALQDLPIATVPASSGYDGQFYAQIALDPLLRSPELKNAIDAPAYRARRILVPASAAVAGFGRPWWTLQAFALVNVACWLGLSWLVLGWVGAENWQSWARWAGCLFSMGVLESVRQSLVDLPALLLLGFAMRSWTDANGPRTALTLALGNLAKETDLLGSVALLAESLSTKARRWPAALVLLASAVPIAVWSFYVHERFAGPAASEALDNFDWPFVALYKETKLCCIEVIRGNLDGRYTFGLVAIIGLATQMVVLWRRPQFMSPWWRVGAAYSFLLPFLGLWVWSGYWAACRAVLPMTIAFNLLLPANRAFWPIWILGNATLVHAIWRFL